MEADKWLVSPDMAAVVRWTSGITWRGDDRADRHAAALAKAVEPPEAEDVTDAAAAGGAARARAGRSGVVSAALAEFSGWTAATLPLLRRAGARLRPHCDARPDHRADGGAVVMTKRGVARPHPLWLWCARKRAGTWCSVLARSIYGKAERC